MYDDDVLTADEYRLKYQAAVQNGAEFLDGFFPDWLDSIDLTTLNIEHNERCVLAQLCGSFDEGVTITELDEEQLWEYGFDLTVPNIVDDMMHYEFLTCLWKDEINNRREALENA